MGNETYHAGGKPATDEWDSNLIREIRAILREVTDPETARNLAIQKAVTEARLHGETRQSARELFEVFNEECGSWSDADEFYGARNAWESALLRLPDDSQSNVVQGKFGNATAEDDPIVSLADWLANPAAPIEWLMEKLIAKDTVNVIAGRAFGGKSLSVMNRGLCMTAGVDWLGFKVPRPLVVLYVDEEMGRPLMESRLLLMRNADPRFQSAEVAERFLILSRVGVRLDEKKWQDAIRRLVEKRKVDHLVWDTLRRLHSGNEDRSEEMAPVFRFLSLLRSEHGASNEVLHHTKKNPEEGANWLDAIRGSGDIIAAADAVIGFWKEEKCFTLRADSKHAGEVEPLTLALDPETLWFHAAEPTVSGLEQAVLEVLATCTPGEGLSTNRIFRDKRVSGRYSEVMAALGRLREAGKVREEGERKAHVWIAV